MVPFTKLSILWFPYSFLLSPALLDPIPTHSSASKLTKYLTWGLLYTCKDLFKASRQALQVHTSLFKFKDVMKKLESSSLAVRTPLEIGGEDFYGHYAHRKRVTVGVNRCFPLRFGWQPASLWPKVRKHEKSQGFLSNHSFLADTLWIMVYDGGGWVLNAHS